MPFRARRTRAALLLVVGLLASLVVAGVSPAAVAADDKGLVNGNITCPKLSKCPGLKLLWFDKDWSYIGQRKLGVGARGYSLTLPAGTYHLQFVDQREAYEVKKFAPTEVQVTIEANRLTERNVTMKKGAAITGRALNGKGRPLRSAKIVAANKSGQSFSTIANDKGEFAVGGLPQGQYSIFTYDHARYWVGDSTWAGTMKPGQSKNIRIKLTRRAGDLTVYLFKPDGLLKAKATLTVTSKQNGQWWTATSGNGTFVFKGLYPGGYTAKFDGAGVWLPKTGEVQGASVKSGRFDSAEFRVTKRGGWLHGVVVDSSNPEIALEGAVVQLYDGNGTVLDEDTSDADGEFTLDGQLTTRNDLTVVVQPGQYTDFLGSPSARCEYTRTEYGGVAVRTGEETWMGDVGIDRKPDGTCNAPGRWSSR